MHGRTVACTGAWTHAQGNKPITELIEDAYILKVICIQIGGYLNKTTIPHNNHYYLRI